MQGSNNRIANVGTHVGIVAAGLAADARHLVSRARDEAAQYLDTYHQIIPSKVALLDPR